MAVHDRTARSICERLLKQRHEYENTPHDWSEEKEEVVDPELWTDAATLIETQAALLEKVEEVERRLRDQSDEPWPGGSEGDRLHYWRDKAIEAANALAKLKLEQ